MADVPTTMAIPWMELALIGVASLLALAARFVSGPVRNLVEQQKAQHEALVSLLESMVEQGKITSDQMDFLVDVVCKERGFPKPPRGHG